ncbi:hypothetical protein B0H13DRAFT_1857253 [Mycena leptocephala]|nr:hypothetical protein B0H13DRAFT_1857253 [Mycena leptocephala]
MTPASRGSAFQRKTNVNSRPRANGRPWDVSPLAPSPLALLATLPVDEEEEGDYSEVGTCPRVSSRSGSLACLCGIMARWGRSQGHDLCVSLRRQAAAGMDEWEGECGWDVPRLPLHLILFYSYYARTLSFFPTILSCPPLSPPSYLLLNARMTILDDPFFPHENQNPSHAPAPAAFSSKQVRDGDEEIPRRRSWDEVVVQYSLDSYIKPHGGGCFPISPSTHHVHRS